MNKTRTIRSLLAGFLLLVFSLGITPKQYLHDLFAHHRDSTGVVKHALSFDVSVTRFNCDFHNQVAESPFIADEYREEFQVTVFGIAPSVPLVSALHHIDLLIPDLRGPPITA